MKITAAIDYILDEYQRPICQSGQFENEAEQIFDKSMMDYVQWYVAAIIPVNVWFAYAQSFWMGSERYKDGTDGWASHLTKSVQFPSFWQIPGLQSSMLVEQFLSVNPMAQLQV